MIRHELKYLVPEDRVEDLVRDLNQFLVHDVHADAADSRNYQVRSLYFDTRSMRCYFEKLHGDAYRSKVRIRRYEVAGAEPSDWYLEIKSRFHQACVKPRRLAFADRVLVAHLREYGTVRLRELVDTISPDRAVSHQPTIWGLPLEPRLLILYDREALVDAHRGGVRVTLDSNVHVVYTRNPYEPMGPVHRVPLPLVMEVKFERNLPVWLEIIVRKYQLRPEPISKYNQGAEAAFPLVGVARARAFSDEGISPHALGLLKLV